MKYNLLATIECFAKNDILQMIPASEYERIKEIDPEPEFRAYVVAHEGKATPSMLTEYSSKAVVSNWYRNAIRALADKIRAGIKFFHLHRAGTNSNEMRQPIGEVVGKGVKDINGKLSTVVVAYIYPEFRDMKLDVASIEANIIFKKQKNEYIIDDIENVTGIALGNSAVISPAFPGATMLGAIQAFMSSESGRRGKNSEGGKSMDLQEIKEAILAAKVKPSDIFGEDELKQDAVVTSIIKQEKLGEYMHRKRTDEEFDKARAEWEKEKKTYEEKLRSLNVALAKNSIGGMFKELATQRKLDEKQVAFIERALKHYEIKDDSIDEAKIKSGLDEFITKQLDEYNETLKILGVKKEDEEDKSKTNNQSKDSDETSDGSLENPKANEFIAVEND